MTTIRHVTPAAVCTHGPEAYCHVCRPDAVSDRLGNLSDAIQVDIARTEWNELVNGTPPAIPKSVADIRDLIERAKFQDPLAASHKTIKISKDVAKEVTREVVTPVSGTVSTVFGFPVIVDDTLPSKTIFVMNNPPYTPPPPFAPVIGLPGQQPPITAEPRVKKKTVWPTLTHDEPMWISHDFATPDYIVQVIHVMTGQEVPHNELTIHRYAQSIELIWRLNDLSPVEEVSIGVMVVMVG